MSSIEVLRVPSEKFTHDCGYSQFAALKQKVDMGVHKNSGEGEIVTYLGRP